MSRYDPIKREANEAKKRAIEKRAAKQFRADAQEVMALPAMRRLLAQHFAEMGVDAPTYRTDPHNMVVAATMRDTACWWLEAMREHCPERETQMRAEARTATKELQQQLEAIDTDEDEASDERNY